MTMLSVDAQMGYLVQWFVEWSELQRSDFLPVLAEELATGTNNSSSSIGAAYVNGIVNSIAGIHCHQDVDKPMSLYECRIKLFREWILQWTPEQRERFMKRIVDIDPAFGEKLNSELQNNNNNDGGGGGDADGTFEENEVSSIES